MSFLSYRCSDGLRMVGQEVGQCHVWKDLDESAFPKEGSKNVKVMCFSPCGDLLAYSTGDEVKVVKLVDGGKWALAQSLPHTRVNFLTFSPCGSTLATWDIFLAKTNDPNLKLWDPLTGQSKGAFVQKKANFWKPQWSKDEKICCIRSPNNEVNVYKDNNFQEVDKRLSISKMESFSLSPTSQNGYHLVCFIPGQKGGPGFGKLFTYPNFNAERDVIANKSFFQADKMDTEWSSCGKMALLLTQSEVDKTGASYYGKQQLHFMSSTGDTAMVQLAKDGPIYEIKWHPARPEFCVVYGYMPARATLYNGKCEKVFDFGTGARNAALFNPQGSLLLLGGFGNLRGNVEIWDVKEKKQVSQFEATDSTDLRWSPNGQFLMTSTCAPRLRQGNGFKIWHYSSSLLHEQPIQELWEVTWQNQTKCPDFKIDSKPVKGIEPKQPVASKQAYVPPSLRNKGPSKFKLREDDEPAENMKKPGDENLSKSAAKNKKRRDNKKKAEEENKKLNPSPNATQASSVENPEKAKKIFRLNEKLKKIHTLKEKVNEGVKLELNQLEMIKKEEEIVKEIQALKL